MQYNGCSGSGGGRIQAEDVISKLKDDGDFDRLRLKIIRKLKENEELRSNIISMVKQSAALNDPGAENMKPRQISDAIHREIGDKLMSRISDGVWSIIRSPDGMKTEITETVQAIYDKLSNPLQDDKDESSSHKDLQQVHKRLESNGHAARVIETDSEVLNGDPNGPEEFGLTDGHLRNKNYQMVPPNNIGIPINHNELSTEGNHEENLCLDALPVGTEPDTLDDDAPPGFSSVIKHKNSGETSDEDPDVPPGFG